ncbi:transposase [Legionella bozemanae]|uniref:transposase n=1 Tax=Legionella bozemanae TaxID=447 RepID=UPI00399C663E
MKNLGGRPRKLTQEIKEAIIEGVSRGLTLKAACKCAGISYSSLAYWKRFTKLEGEEAIFYADLTRGINAAIRFAQYQQRQKALAALQLGDYKFRSTTKIKLTRKEREQQVIENIGKRIEALEKKRYKP